MAFSASRIDLRLFLAKTCHETPGPDCRPYGECCKLSCLLLCYSTSTAPCRRAESRAGRSSTTEGGGGKRRAAPREGGRGRDGRGQEDVRRDRRRQLGPRR